MVNRAMQAGLYWSNDISVKVIQLDDFYIFLWTDPGYSTCQLSDPQLDFSLDFYQHQC